jgi:hypothetical protein
LGFWDLVGPSWSSRFDLCLFARAGESAASAVAATKPPVTALFFSEQRCLRHPTREAVARCPECRNFFCRECITEHDDRVLCSDCLAKLLRASAKETSFVAQIASIFFGVIGIATACLFFYFLGWSLSRAPASFHEGTIWQKLLPEK